MRYWIRLLLGGILGIYLGTEIYVYGFATLINPTVFLPHMILYLLLFSITDDFIVRYKLVDRDLFLLGAIFALLFDGIFNQIFFETDRNVAMITFMGINFASVLLDAFSWGVYLIWTFHLIKHIIPRNNTSSSLGKKGWILIISTLFLIAIAYSTNIMRPQAWVSILLFLTIMIILSIWLAWSVKLRRKKYQADTLIQKSNFILTLTISFIIIGSLSAAFGLQNIFPVPLHLVLFILFYLPATLIYLSRKRVAI